MRVFFGFSQVFSALYGTGPTLTVTTLQEGNQLGGFFRLNFNGQVTAPIRHDAAATGTKSVSQRLQALGGNGHEQALQSGALGSDVPGVDQAEARVQGGPGAMVGQVSGHKHVRPGRERLRDQVGP